MIIYSMAYCLSSFQTDYFWWNDKAGKAEGENASYHTCIRPHKAVIKDGHCFGVQ